MRPPPPELASNIPKSALEAVGNIFTDPCCISPGLGPTVFAASSVFKVKYLVPEVVKTSDGYIGQTGDKIELSVKEGDKVLINNGAGQKVKLVDGNTYHLVRESEILMIL